MTITTEITAEDTMAIAEALSLRIGGGGCGTDASGGDEVVVVSATVGEATCGDGHQGGGSSGDLVVEGRGLGFGEVLG